MGNVVIHASRLPGEGVLWDRVPGLVEAGYQVRAPVIKDDFGYWLEMSRIWDDQDAILVNVEHDMEITAEHVTELVECEHPLCSWAYHAHWISTHMPHDIYAAGAGAREIAAQPDAYYLQGGEEWAQWSAIGFVKIAPEARIAPLDRAPWNSLELSVERAVTRPWHMHWNRPELREVIHHHW